MNHSISVERTNAESNSSPVRRTKQTFSFRYFKSTGLRFIKNSITELVNTTSTILRENSMNSLNIAKAMAPEQNVPETVLKVCSNCGKSFDDELQFLG